MKIFEMIKNFVYDVKENYIVNRLHKLETWKFNQPERVKIQKTVKLTQKQKQAIDDLYINNYGKKIPYTWHQHYTAYTGRFDEKYMPELIYFPEFERYMNVRRAYITAFEDKNILPFLSVYADVKTPDVLFSNIWGLIKNSNNEILSNDEFLKQISDLGKCFVKPSIDTSSGRGCCVLDIHGGIDINSNRQVNEMLAEIGDNWIIQKCIICHESVKKLHSNSVNTFRIMTYRWKDSIYHVPIIMRIGQGGSNLDNAHAGGMFIAVDDDGSFHDTAFTEFNVQFKVHPDSKIVFKDYKIDLLPEVIKAAELCHSLIPQLGIVNWDFTLDEKGNPLLIEANICGGSIWLFEMAHGKGIFGNKTEEVLNWMRFMRSLKPSERSKYSFGKMKKN